MLSIYNYTCIMFLNNIFMQHHIPVIASEQRNCNLSQILLDLSIRYCVHSVYERLDQLYLMQIKDNCKR